MSDSDEFRLDSDSVSASENEGDRPARRKGASSPKKSVSKLPAKRTPKRKAEDDAGDDGREGDASGTEDAAAGEDKVRSVWWSAPETRFDLVDSALLTFVL